MNDRTPNQDGDELMTGTYATNQRQRIKLALFVASMESVIKLQSKSELRRIDCIELGTGT